MNNPRQKILVVDDEPINIQVLNEILKGQHNVYFAASGAKALEIAEAEQPDMILLDIMMPVMDGFEVCARLKKDKQTRDIPVLFITALNMEEDEAKGFAVGAVDYITKPIRPAIVRARVNTHLELKRQRDILANLSLLDGLTGIANRRRFDESLEREWRRAARSKTLLSLIMIDIDYFKLFNDTYGHGAGDECLRRVANAIAASLERPGDIAARYGGEEFACILPETGAEGLIVTAENIQKQVAELVIPHKASLVSSQVTISMGGATMQPEGGRIQDKLALLNAADNLLYQAKHEGRNRVCLAG